jgi:diguanylate cyclase
MAELELDSSGAPVRLTGTTHDITERKHIERELQLYADAQTRLSRELTELTNSLELQVEERTDALKRLSIDLERLVDERTAELEASRSELAHQVQHDPLTGLPNRKRFEVSLQTAIERASQTGDAVAVLFIDLDGFKLANDSLGHNAGDSILSEVGQRLLQHHDRAGIVARHGGDEFVALVERVADDNDARRLARTFLDAIRQPYFLDGHTIQISASIGIAVFPRDAESPTELLRKADVAMYRAKLSGKNDIRVYRASMDADLTQRLDIATHLSEAIAQSELSLHYQPQLNVVTGTIRAFEAQLRWHSPVLGNVSPENLIAVAEQTGTIVDIGDWVLEEACRQLAHWSMIAEHPLQMSIDVAAAQLARSDFVDIVDATLQRHNLHPAQLELELTERTLSRDLDLSRSRLQALGDIGVRIAIDNFGLRGSSLQTLVYLPVQTVKIDPAFVQDIPEHMPSDRAVQAIVSLAQGIGLEVVAEGVDNHAQRARMVQLGSTRLQGMLIGRPADASRIDAMLSIRNHGHGSAKVKSPGAKRL